MKTNCKERTTNLLQRATLTILFILLMTVAACTVTGSGRFSGTGNDRKQFNCGEAGFIEGWCNDNTYRLILAAPPSAKSRTDDERKLSSKKLAVFTAQERILEKFKDMGIDVLHCEFDPVAYKIASEVRESIKNGKVISEKWDEDFNCELIYEVYSKQLKKKVKNSAFIRP